MRLHSINLSVHYTKISMQSHKWSTTTVLEMNSKVENDFIEKNIKFINKSTKLPTLQVLSKNIQQSHQATLNSIEN